MAWTQAHISVGDEVVANGMRARKGALWGGLSHRFCFFIFSLLLLAFAPTALFAAPQPGETVVKFRGQDLYVRGNPIVKYLPEGSDGTTMDAELVLSYTNYADSVINSLRTELKFEARVLVVGGGGAGGYGTTTSSNPGGGGGGGEVIELGNKGTRRGNSAPFLFSKDSLTEYG